METIKVFAENGANIRAYVRSKTVEFEEYISLLSEEYKVLIEPIYFNMTEDVELKLGFMKMKKDKRCIDILVNNADSSISACQPDNDEAKIREHS